MKSMAHPLLRGRQLLPASSVVKTPPPESPKYILLGSRGSMMMEWSLGPSGVPLSSGPLHFSRSG